MIPLPPSLGTGLVFGGLGLGQSLFAGIAANQQAQAQAIVQRMQAENANFQRQWQVMANNRQINRNNLARAINNKKIERAALNDRAIQEVYTKLGYDNSRSQFSKQTNQVNGALLSSISGRNMSQSSGTARALLRQNLESASSNMANMSISNNAKLKDISMVYQNKLAQRDFNYEDFQFYLPGSTAQASTPMGPAIIGAGLSGLSAGISGSLQYGGGANNWLNNLFK